MRSAQRCVWCMQQFPQQYPQKLWQTQERNRGFKSISFVGAPERRSAACKSNRMSDLIAHVDGGSHGSPGPSGIGVVITKPDGEMVRIAKWIGHHDNNVAEYAALLEALQFAVELKAT